MTIVVSTQAQDPIIAQMDQADASLIVSDAKPGSFSVGGNNFTFFAGFDGTNNDKGNLSLSGTKYETNVAMLVDQVAKANPINVQTGYYPGLGTTGTLFGSSMVPGQVTLQAQITAKIAYVEFQRWAIATLESNPSASFSVSLTSFSRGDASAAIFSQLVYENGVVDPSNPLHYYIQPGQVSFSGGVLFDPVTTGTAGNLAFAPNAKNLVAIVAANEYRIPFEGTTYTSDPSQITTQQVLGNHVDIGGGYDNGIGLITLQAATDFLSKSGLPISNVTATDSRRIFNPGAVAIHEENTIDGIPWPNYGHFSTIGAIARQFSSSPIPGTINGSVQSMILQSGGVETITTGPTGEIIEDNMVSVNGTDSISHVISSIGSNSYTVGDLTRASISGSLSDDVKTVVYINSDQLNIPIANVRYTTLDAEGDTKNIDLGTSNITLNATGSSGVVSTLTGTTNAASSKFKWVGGDGTTYFFSPYDGGLPNIGSMTVTNGVMGSNQLLIANFDLNEAENYANGYLDIKLPGQLLIGQGAAVSNNSFATMSSDFVGPRLLTQNSPSASTFLEGSSQSYTISVDTASNVAQTIKVTLSGAQASDFELLNGGVASSLGSDGSFNIGLAAGETNVSFSLIDITAENGKSDIASGATLQLSATLPAPSQGGGTALSATPETINYVPSSTAEGGPLPKTFNVISANTPGTYYGDSGNDLIAATGAVVNIYAQYSVDDSITGSAGQNYIQGGNGNDLITLNGTSDTVYTGRGATTVNGSLSSQAGLISELGNKGVVVGNGGKYVVFTDQGNYEVYGGAKTTLDQAIAQQSAAVATHKQGDLFAAADGNNTIVGDNGNDLFFTGSGKNVLVLGPGDDTVMAGMQATAAQAAWSATLTPSSKPNSQPNIQLSGIAAFEENFVNTAAQPYNGNSDPGSGQNFGVSNDTIFAGNGNDAIWLGNGNNYVLGGAGNDTIQGGVGNDTIIAGSGTTIVHGGGGNTYIQGGSGTDSLFGGDGNNTIIGGSGNATIDASNGPNASYDFANASLTQNYVNGGSGNDLIFGSAGTDTLIAGTGNTTIQGESGTDYIVGGSGNDQLIAGSGNATVMAGGAGNDSLYGGTGKTSSYVLYGGNGTDDIYAQNGMTTIYGGNGGVAGAFTTLAGSQSDASSSVTINGGLGVDLIEGGLGSSVLYAGDGGTSAGATTVVGYSGASTIYGGLGTDLLQSGSGTSLVYAGDGGTAGAPTTVLGGSGVASMYGGAGDVTMQDTVSGQDVLAAASGNATLLGMGSDTLVAGTGDDFIQSNGPGVSIQLGAAYGNDTVVGATGSENLSFASGDAPTDFVGGAALDAQGNVYLKLSGTEGQLFVQGALTGSLGSIKFADSGNVTTSVLLKDVFGGDATLSLGNSSLSLGLTNGESIAGSSSISLISSWGDGTTINGGAGSGSETIYAAGAGDLITANAVGSSSIVAAGSNDSIIGNSPYAEVVVLSGANDVVTASANGYDTLTASGSHDTIYGSGVAETIYVNDASAVVVLPVSGQTNDTIISSVSYVAPANLGTLKLSGTAPLMATGNAAADTLIAGSGSDTLAAGTGLATMVGGSGSDTFVVNNAADVINNASVSGNNQVRSSVSFTAPINVNTLVLTGSANLTGTANSGADTLVSNTGIDTLVGGSGTDTFVVQNSADVVQAVSAGGVVQSSVNYALPSSVNTLVLTGSAALTGTANANGDTLVSNSGIDTLTGGAGNDVFVVNNAADVLLNVSANDTVQYAVGLTVPTGVSQIALTGSANLSVTGNAGSDVITANSGNDTLIAGSGLATLVGGSGNDLFVVDNVNDVVQNAASNPADTIQSSVSYVLPANVGVLVLTGTAALSATANAGTSTLVSNTGVDTLIGGAGNDTFVVNNASDVVNASSTAVNNVLQSSVSFTLPANVGTLLLTGSANLVGTSNSSNDLITGNAGADKLIATTGADTLVAGTGIDTLVGGSGNDLFVVNSAADVVSMAGAHGSDTIQSSVSLTLPSTVNTLVLSGAANLSGTALSGNNLLVGNAGNDSLVGGAGQDTLVAGAGADTLVGGAGGTTFVVNNAADTIQNIAAAASNSVVSSVGFVLPTHIDSLTLTGNANLAGTGNNDATNVLRANTGNDTLTSGSGVTTFYGGSGNGRNTFVVNNANDVIVANNDTEDTIVSSVSYAMQASQVALTLTGTANLQGKAGNQSAYLAGNAGSDTLIAGTGNDTLVAGGAATTLIGGLGNDVFIINSATDVIQGAAAGEFNTLISSVSATLSTNINTLILTGTGNVTGQANGANDSISANGGNDTLYGGAGIDTLAAGAGLATLVGGTGATTFIVNNVGDSVQGAAAGVANTLLTSVTFTAPTNVNAVTLTGASSIAVTGNSGADSLTGGWGIDTLVAGSGVATLIGGTGNTTFVVNNVADVVQDLFAASSNTLQSSVSFALPTNVNALVLTGAANVVGTANGGADTLTSNSGIDTLIGGAGNDVFVVNNAADVVRDSSATASNTIQSAVNFTLPTNVNTLLLTGTSNLQGVANGGADTLTSNSGIDTLIGGAGNDTFIVNNTSDVVQDGSTTSTNAIYSNVNFTLPANVNALTLTGSANLMASGNAANDLITANSGSDTLIAGTGIATLVGGAGNDLFVVNNTNDLVQNASTVSNDTVQSSVSYTLGSNVNTLALTGTANLTAPANGGNDTLVSNSGIDTLVGGAGSDVFVVNNSADVLQNLNATDTVLSSVAYTLPTGAAALVLIGASNIAGSDNATGDTLVGSSANDTLIAGTGPSTLIGGSGNTTFVVNRSWDVVQNNSSTNSDTIQSSSSERLPGNVDTLVLTGSGNLTGWGNTDASNVIAANSGADVLYGLAYQTTLLGGSGNDVLYAGPGSNVIQAGDGNTTVYGNATGTSVLTQSSIYGGAGSDVIYGGPGENVIHAGTGATSIFAGTGANTLYGANGSLLQDDSAHDSIGGQSLLVAGSGQETLVAAFGDTIEAGSSGQLGTTNVTAALGQLKPSSTLEIDGGIAPSDLTVSSDDSKDVILTGKGGTITINRGLIPYSETADGWTLNGTSFTDWHVTLAPLNIQFGSTNESYAQLMAQRGVSGTYHDAFGGKDVILDTGSNETITPGALNCTVASFGSNVRITTGQGNGDGSSFSTLIYAAGNGDTIAGAWGYANTEIATGDQTLVLGAGWTNDVLVAYGHNDTLSGDANLTNYEVYDPSTTVVIPTGAASYNVSVGIGVSYVAPTGDQYMYTLADNVVGTANSLADVLIAFNNGDTMQGGAAADTLVAFGKDDVLTEGAAPDDFWISDASDTIQFGANIAADTIHSSVNYTLPTGATRLVMTSPGAVGAGNAGADYLAAAIYGVKLVAGSGNDTLDSGAQWAETLVGGAGKDVFIVNDASDVVTEAFAGTQSEIISSVNFTLPQNIDNLVLTGSAALSGTGNAENDLITANSGNDTLVAGSGRDTLVAGTGLDTFQFNQGFGNDSVIGALNGETIAFGTGVLQSNLTFAPILNAIGAPSLIITGANGSVTVAGGLVPGIIGNVKFGDGTVKSLKQLIAEGALGPMTVAGGSGNLIMSAMDSANITGGAGTDTIDTWGNNDTLAGGAGANVIYAGGTADSVSSGSGNSTLVAGGTSDTLIGGTGSQAAFYLNDSSQVLVAPTGANSDTVFASISYALPAGTLTNLTLTGNVALQATGNALTDVIVANAGSDTLVSGTGSDTLVGGAGNDLFVVNSMPDVVQIGATHGVDTVQSYVSYAMPENASVLNLIGSSNIVGTGNDQAGLLVANAIGYDTLVGGTGLDTLVGGAPMIGTDGVTLVPGSELDTLIGSGGGESLLTGTGGDSLVGGVGVDTFMGQYGSFYINNPQDVIEGLASSVHVFSSVSYQLTSNGSLTTEFSSSSLTFTGSGNISGGDGGFAIPIITGNSGNDSLVSSGFDITTIVSGSGVDTLVGNAYATDFVVNNTADVVQAQANRPFYNTISSSVSLVLPSNVDVLQLTGSAALVGTGNSDADQITANAGDDTLIAGSGIATLTGGAGNETFIINNTADSVTGATAGKNNVLQSSVSFTLPANVNTLILTGSANVSGQGNAGADSMLGNAGADTLTAGSGTDTLSAGTGLVTMIGGSGLDTFIVNNSADVVQDATTGKANVVQSSASFVLPTNVNTLILTGTGNINGTGNAGADKITANSGNDSLVAGAGADTLIAGSGTDTLISGTGVDSLVGGTGVDLFVVNNASDHVTVGASHGSDTIQSSVNFTLPVNVDALQLVGAANLSATGGASASILAANSGADTLTAGAGLATMIGGSGADLFVVNNVGDVVQVGATHGADTIKSSVSFTLPNNVANLTLTGTAALSGTGNALANVLTANTGADTLVAGSGSATLIGGTGADLFVINGASDVVQVGTTHGVDTIQSSVSDTLAANVANLVLTGSAALIGTGNSLADAITANSGNDTLVAGSGVATLVGGAGNDLFIVNSASDKINVGTTHGADSIQSSVSYTLPSNVQSLTLSGTAALTGTGNTATSLVVGNTGADTLVGGTGIAVLEAGTAGAQVLKATANQAALIGGGAANTLTGGAFKDFLAAGKVADTITGGATANVIAVNKGDGATVLSPTSGASNVLSLGGGIDTENLAFTKTGNNLVLTDSVTGDSITFTNWYSATTNQTTKTLQVIEDASASYNSAGTDALRNKPREAFNFTSLVAAFTAAGSTAGWKLSNAMAADSIALGTNVAYGGDLAYYFGHNGNLTGMNLAAAQSTLTNASFGTGTQTIDAWTGISGGATPLAVAASTSPGSHRSVGQPITSRAHSQSLRSGGLYADAMTSLVTPESLQMTGDAAAASAVAATVHFYDHVRSSGAVDRGWTSMHSVMDEAAARLSKAPGGEFAVESHASDLATSALVGSGVPGWRQRDSRSGSRSHLDA